MKYLGTENCVICGKKSKYWHGSLRAREKKALGFVETKVAAGFCELHYKDTIAAGTLYDPSVMGRCVPIFN